MHWFCVGELGKTYPVALPMWPTDEQRNEGIKRGSGGGRRVHKHKCGHLTGSVSQPLADPSYNLMAFPRSKCLATGTW